MAAKFAIEKANVMVEFYAGIGVKYELIIDKGNLTVAAVHLGGNLLFVTTPETVLSGELFGKVTVLNISAGFKMETSIKM
ncbi:MAG: hypothetical protein HC896_01715 [Bacteroidales bacterium]|nr:hypothetical protein [Bacteroidales bacterium]